jgi:DNA-directed RNA polymerase specialized sigma24 family protein
MTLLSFKPVAPDGAPRHPGDRQKEKMFLECYSWLVECALNITHGQRERAEDLVHDVFVRFLDNDKNIASISDVRGYLNGMVRNLHLLQLRRATRHSVQSLTLVDYDSALVGLRTWNSVEQLQSADLLLRACDFACYRKEAALTSSVLILRFFHGFYPGEICRLLRAKRKAVDKWIERGRNRDQTIP